MDKRLHDRERKEERKKERKRERKTTSCQQLMRKSPIQCCLDMGPTFSCSHPRQSSIGEIFRMLTLSTFLTKRTRQKSRNRSLPLAHRHQLLKQKYTRQGFLCRCCNGHLLLPCNHLQPIQNHQGDLCRDMNSLLL